MHRIWNPRTSNSAVMQPLAARALYAFPTKQVQVCAMTRHQTPPAGIITVVIHFKSGHCTVSYARAQAHSHACYQPTPPSIPNHLSPHGGISWEEAPVPPWRCGIEPCTGCWSLSQPLESSQTRWEWEVGEAGVVVRCESEHAECQLEVMITNL